MILLTHYVDWNKGSIPVVINPHHIVYFEPSHIETAALNLAGGLNYSEADATSLTLIGDITFRVTESFDEVCKAVGGVRK